MSALISINDEALLALAPLTTNLQWEQIGEYEYKVRSSRWPFVKAWYTVELLDDKAKCNCAASEHCRHICKIVLMLFPSIAMEADLMVLRAGLEKDERDRRAWAERALKHRQSVFNRVLRERRATFRRELTAKPDGSFETATAPQAEGVCV